MRGTSKYVRSRSQPSSASMSLMWRFESGWWMNIGLSFPKISA
jgi:hypothetical protein